MSIAILSLAVGTSVICLRFFLRLLLRFLLGIGRNTAMAIAVGSATACGIWFVAVRGLLIADIFAAGGCVFIFFLELPLWRKALQDWPPDGPYRRIPALAKRWFGQSVGQQVLPPKIAAGGGRRSA